MFVLADFPYSLDLPNLHLQLKIDPATENGEAFDSFLQQVEEIARPKAVYLDSFIEFKGEDSVIFEGSTFYSPALRLNLAKVNRIFPYIATCGSEIDSFEIEKGDLVRQMWLYTIKLNLLQLSLQAIKQDIRRRNKFSKLSSMNPGSGDFSVWPIEQQQLLFSIFGGAEAGIGVKLTPSLMIQPDISTSGIFFPAETTYQNCQLCKRQDCDYRQAAFDQKLWEMVN